MENEYNILEKRLSKERLTDSERLKILERQKELLLDFLIESNKGIFEALKLRKVKPIGIVDVYNKGQISEFFID